MADKTIPQLEPKTTISSTDLIPIDDNTQTYKTIQANRMHLLLIRLRNRTRKIPSIRAGYMLQMWL